MSIELSPLQQQIELEVSHLLETNHVPDNYKYLMLHGKLCSPITGRPVENSIRVNSSTDASEMEAFQTIQSWTKQNETGVVAWISPRHPDTDDTDAKVIFSTIAFENGNKVLTHRAIMFNWDAEKCLNFAQELDPAGNYLSSEELRKTPVFLQEEIAQQLLTILARHSPEQVEMIRSGKDVEFKKEITVEFSQMAQNTPFYYWEVKAREAGLVGKYKGSCPSSSNSAFDTVLENSQPIKLGEEKTLHCTCPFCHAQVEAIITGRRIHCPACGQSAEYHC